LKSGFNLKPHSGPPDDPGTDFIDLNDWKYDEIVEIIEDIVVELVELETDKEEPEIGITVIQLSPEMRNKLICRDIIQSHIIPMENEADGAIRVFSHEMCYSLFFTDQMDDEEE